MRFGKVKQVLLPGVGATVDTLFSCLPFLSFINFIFISIVVYADIHPYLKVYIPWVQIWMFMLSLAVVTVILMLAVYKFVLPSLWAFRGKQLFGFESEVLDALGRINKRLGIDDSNQATQKKVAVSGGFDPIHIGHVRHIQAAMKMGYVVAILTRDDQLVEKKGKVFMPYEERKEVLEAVLGDKGVVVSNVDASITSRMSILRYRPDIFAKGGDTWDSNNLPETVVCSALGIEVVFGVGGEEKVQSSSALTKENVV